MSNINTTLNERGARYGNYSDVAGVTQALVSIVESGASYEHLNAEQKTSLFMICNKIARAVNGDPQYFDNYRDIAGYATLQDGKIAIEGRVGSVDGATLLKAELQGDVNQAEHLGVILAQNLLAQGAGDLLKALYS